MQKIWDKTLICKDLAPYFNISQHYLMPALLSSVFTQSMKASCSFTS